MVIVAMVFVDEFDEDEVDCRAEQLLEEVRGASETTPQPRTRKRSVDNTSLGRTPKSAVQSSLARLGMINSPDHREIVTTLEKFMAQFVDGKELGLDEEDIRNQMAAAMG